MPQLRASRRSLLYTFIVCQLLLNVTFSTAAVIRRDKRQISSTVSVTETTPFNAEVATVRPTTETENEFLTEKEADLIVSTTAGNEKNTSVTAVTRQVGDEWPEEEYELDEEDERSPPPETRSRSNRIEETTNEDVKMNDKRDLTTVSSGDLNENEKTTIQTEIEGTTGSRETLFTTNAPTTSTTSTIPTTTQPEIESTSQVKTDSTTFSETSSGDDTTEFKLTREDVAPSTHQPVTTDVSNDSTQSGTEEPSTGQPPLEAISTTIVNSAIVENSTFTDENILPKSHSSATSVNPIATTTTSTDPTIESSANNESKMSTKTLDETTVLSRKEDSTTISADETTAMSKPLTSTFKSDDSTIMFLTSTETFDEDGAQTTFQASPLIQEPSASLDEKNSSTTSAEKRGKFIDDNYSYLNELRLSNTSDTWGLGGTKVGEKVKSAELQNSVETSDEKAINHSMVTKALLDWSRVMESTDAMASETTQKTSEFVDPTMSSVSTETSVVQDYEVQTSTMKPVTTDTVNLTNRIADSTAVVENEVVTNIPETTTTLATKEIFATTPERILVDDTSLSQTDDVPSTTIVPVTDLLAAKTDVNIENNQVEVGDTTTTESTIATTLPITTTSPTTTTTETSTSPILTSATMKSETTTSPVDGETTEEQNTGTILTSSVSLIDFTTPIPFLTPTTVTTTTTTSTKTSTTPENAFNMDDRTNETPDMPSTLIPEQVTAIATATTTTKTTTTTTMTITPAVTVMAATTDETQKTETEAHTPAIISNDTANNNTTTTTNNNNDAEVSSETPTTATNTKSADSSSREAFEASTRVEPNLAASTADTRTPYTAEVNSLDDLNESTESNFESSNTYDGAPSPTTTTVGGILKFDTDTQTIATATTVTSKSTSKQEDLERIDSIQKISDTGETSIESNVIDPLQAGEASTTTTTTTAPPPPAAVVPTATTTTTTTSTSTTTEKSEDNMRMPSTERGWVTEDSSLTTTTTTTTARPSYDDTTTPLQSISTKNEDLYSIVPQIDNGGFHVPKLTPDDTTTTMSGILTAGAGQPMDSSDGQETDVNVIIAISVSVVGIVALILLVAFLYVMRKRQKQMSYGQRCRPVSLDAYSLDNVSVYNSVRRKGAALRASKRSYGNVAFDDPSLRHNVLGTHELAKFVEKKSSIWDEFKDVPQIIARADEVPAGCEDKNRYANVIPLPETRVILQQQNGDEKTEYINANYVRGPKDTANYYIACQAPLETTVIDFWRMIWEQNSRVIIMATDLIENGIDKCAEYLPPSVTLDNHTVFGDFQVTLKNREVKEKYAISTLMLKNTATEESREITHYWYQWPETGVPNDEAAVIAMLLEARSSLKAYAIEQADTKIDTIITADNQTSKKEINGNVTSEKPKPPPKDQGPLTIHCSPGTGRTGTILACDIAMRCLEEPKRCVDIPQIVYSVRRGRASAVQTKEQYEFIYKVTHVYATKISNLNSDN